jgi:hypothetical protein
MQEPQSAEDPVLILANILSAVRRSEAAFGCAAKILSPYVKSSDHWISGAAGVLTNAYTAHRLLDAQLDKWLQDDARKPKDIVTKSAEMSEMKLKREQVWDVVRLGVEATTYALVDMTEPPGERGRHLRITTQRRSELLSELAEIFPNVNGAATPAQWDEADSSSERLFELLRASGQSRDHKTADK